MKTARDSRQYPLQFGELATKKAKQITTSTIVDATTQTYVRITPTTNDAWIQVTVDTATGAVGSGALIPFGSSITLVVPKNYYVTSNTEVNVVPYGFA
jgi:hypothetical protein